MIVHQVSDGYLEVEPDTQRERVRLCNIFGVSTEGIVTIRVTFVRNGLDLGKVQHKFNSPPDNGDLFDEPTYSCQDPSHTPD